MTIESGLDWQARSALKLILKAKGAKVIARKPLNHGIIRIYFCKHHSIETCMNCPDGSTCVELGKRHP
jgi:hypothetical protein